MLGPLGQITVSAYLVNLGPSQVPEPVITFDIPADLTFAGATLAGVSTDVCYVQTNLRKIICDTSSSLVNGVQTFGSRAFALPQNALSFQTNPYKLTLTLNYTACSGSTSRTITASIRSGSNTFRDPNGSNNAVSITKTMTEC